MKNIKKLAVITVTVIILISAISVLFIADSKDADKNADYECVSCSVCNGNGYVITTSCSIDTEGNSFTATAEAKECPVENCCHGIIE